MAEPEHSMPERCWRYRHTIRSLRGAARRQSNHQRKLAILLGCMKVIGANSSYAGPRALLARTGLARGSPSGQGAAFSAGVPQGFRCARPARHEIGHRHASGGGLHEFRQIGSAASARRETGLRRTIVTDPDHGK